MPSSFVRVYLHTTFSTKYRRPNIVPEIEGKVKQLLAHHLQNFDAQVIAINAVADHVHIVHTLPRTVSISKLVQEAKKFTSRTINEQYNWLHLKWQEGYASFSISGRDVPATVDYVGNQQEHHGYVRNIARKETFEEEYTRILLKNGFEIHPRYTLPVAPQDEPAYTNKSDTEGIVALAPDQGCRKHQGSRGAFHRATPLSPPIPQIPKVSLP